LINLICRGSSSFLRTRTLTNKIDQDLVISSGEYLANSNSRVRSSAQSKIQQQWTPLTRMTAIISGCVTAAAAAAAAAAESDHMAVFFSPAMVDKTHRLTRISIDYRRQKAKRLAASALSVVGLTGVQVSVHHRLTSECSFNRLILPS
jgi:hypothetical protein